MRPVPHIGLTLLAAVGLAATAADARIGSTPVYRCSGGEVTLFDNTNSNPVTNGAGAPTFRTKGAWCVTSIRTYHWNNGGGDPPGTVGLARVAGGVGLAATIGPFPAKGTGDQPDGPKVNWTYGFALSRPTVINGTYSCQSSDHVTWSKNAGSGGHGFCVVRGVPAKRVR